MPWNASWQDRMDSHPQNQASGSDFPLKNEMAIIERARQIRQSSESSLDSVAAIIGQETGRARSTVRDVLRRHDQSCDQQIFPEHRALAAREIELCCRARRVGIPLSKCADRLNRSVPAIHRAILKHRVGILKSIPLTWIDQPVFARQDADEVLLGGETLQAGLVGPDQSIHLADIPQPDSSIDLSRWIAASHWLIARASRSLATLSKQPLAMHIDRIECDLLWAGRIRASLVMHGLPASLQACEHWLGRSVESLPREAALNLLEDALRSTWHVLDDIDPGRADRLSARCASAMDRLLSSRTPLARSRASARHQPGDLDIAWPLRQMVPWPTLEPEIPIGSVVSNGLNLDRGRSPFCGGGWRVFAHMTLPKSPRSTARLQAACRDDCIGWKCGCAPTVGSTTVEWNEVDRGRIVDYRLENWNRFRAPG